MVRHPCVNFCQLFVQLGYVLSTFRAARRPSDHIPCGQKTFRQLFVQPRDFPSLSVSFLFGLETFLTLLSTFCQLPSTICAPENLPSISFNFPCRWKYFCELLSILACDREIFQKLPSSLQIAQRTSINFCQLSMRLDDFLSTFCVAGRPSVNFCQISVRPRDLSSHFP